MTDVAEQLREKWWLLLTDAVLESPGTVSSEEAQNIAEDILDTHSGKALLAAAKAEGAREERERILAIVRDTSHDWLEIETRLDATGSPQ